jgi:ABC-type nitrate/sulfonate/bicarbonate transport system substrate-binding protein
VPQGTAPAQGLSQVLQSVGLPNDAAKRVNASYSTMGRMLIQGAVDAMVGLEPFLTLTQQQMKGDAVLLARLGKYVQGGGLFLITDKWAEAHKDRLDEAVAALWEAQHYVTHNPEEAAKIEAEYLGVEPATVEAAFKYLKYNPLIDDFTKSSLDKTAKYLKGEGLISKEVDPQKHLVEANRIIAKLSKSHPDLLK